MKTAIELMERGLAPDTFVRLGIRRLLAQRLTEERKARAQRQDFINTLAQNPIALHTDKANEQHYEVPAEFFQYIMGQQLKYSACYWPDGVETLSQAEAAMLQLSCERAQLEDGQAILELGCGWGSLSLWMAEHYPKSQITAVSNSGPQRAFIEQRCAERGLNNLSVITADMNDFSIDQRFDRVLSVEMFEHMRNYPLLLARIANWLRPGGVLFVHVFSHRHYAYPFETEGEDNWMGQYFFTGGLMPSRDLLTQFQDDLRPTAQWHFNGRHYQRTCEAWLHNQDRHKAEIMAIFKRVYGADAARWFQRWRVFFMACAELFGYANGEEWGVSHYRFMRP
jgi:cyclopropane-fatty-acyl-phospholipid synthase